MEDPYSHLLQAQLVDFYVFGREDTIYAVETLMTTRGWAKD